MSALSSFGSLLDGVFAAPDDDEPRRVYADWLLSNGDPRGELIALQCELFALPAGDPRRPGVEKREQQLLRDHKAGWTLGLRGLELSRGFVESVRLRLEDAGRFRALFEREPVRDLTVAGGKRGAVRDLLPLFTPVLQTLSFAPERQRAAEGLGDWIASGGLRSVERLDLTVAPPDAVEALLDPRSLPALRSLEIAPGVRVAKAVWQKLAARFGPALRENFVD